MRNIIPQQKLKQHKSFYKDYVLRILDKRYVFPTEEDLKNIDEIQSNIGIFINNEKNAHRRWVAKKADKICQEIVNEFKPLNN